MTDKQITLYGAQWCGDCTRAKFLLEKHNMPYEYFDIDQDVLAKEYVIKINPNGNQSIPVIKIKGREEKILIEPTASELEAAILDD